MLTLGIWEMRWNDYVVEIMMEESDEVNKKKKDEPLAVQAATSILSYPAPLWQMYFSDDGSFDTRSRSKGPVNCKIKSSQHCCYSRVPSFFCHVPVLPALVVG